MKDKLLIIDKFKRTILYIDKFLDNFPNRYMEIKWNISKYLDEVLECMYLANNDYDKDMNKNLCIIKIEMIDFYMMKSYKKGIISKKKYESISKHLIEIVKMIYGWKKISEES